jgi:hypothetical protein
MKPTTKKQGLQAFCDSGHILVDATYSPVNKRKGKARTSTILADYKHLTTDLRSLCKSKEIEIILIKANVCRLLESKLRSDSFNVKNGGVVVPFPSHGQQNNFLRQMESIYKNRPSLA